MDAAELDDWLLPLPGTTAGRKWGCDRVYCVEGKMYAVLAEAGPDAGRLSFKVEDERFLELTDQPGIVPAPYLARAHWVLIADPASFPPEWLRERLLTSYRLVLARLPKATQRRLGKPC